jgi:hypothetical protein
MCDNERQRILMFSANVSEMNVEPVDLGDKLGQCIEFGLDLAPVVIGGPIVREFLDRRELHALRFIRDGFSLGPAGRTDTAAEIGECLVRNVDAERTDCAGRRCGSLYCVG